MMNTENYIDALAQRHPELTAIKGEIQSASELLLDCYRSDGKILLCGNGGSAADAEHISGELLKGFISKRRPTEDELAKLAPVLGNCAEKLQRGIPAIPLTSLTSVLSAYANDVDPALVFAQLTYALGKPCDVLVCLSTSGNSKNVVEAARVASALGMRTVALTGEGGGELAEICDVAIKAPACETYKVQEYHLPIYHAICAELERVLLEM